MGWFGGRVHLKEKRKMINYTSVPNISGTFPDVVSLNSTGPGVNDGTPYLKTVIDDLWGFNQALLNAAFQFPDGSAEADGASQRLDALKKILGHPGEVIAWMGNSADPSAVDIRLLPLNGQGVLRTTYPELDAACYVGDPDNPTAPAFYHADDAAGTIRNTAGIYLILPDLRGLFIRGLDVSGSVDPDGVGREVGDVQATAYAKHWHNVMTSNEASKYFLENHYVYTSSQPSTVLRSVLQLENVAGDEGVAAESFTGSSFLVPREESRPVNTAARWCIRF